jgi:hypothetical protein
MVGTSETQGQRASRTEGCSPHERGRASVAARAWPAAGNPASKGSFSGRLLNASMEDCMRRELTPGQARSGAVSGRVITVLLISFLGACVALGLAWAFLMPR